MSIVAHKSVVIREGITNHPSRSTGPLPLKAGSPASRSPEVEEVAPRRDEPDCTQDALTASMDVAELKRALEVLTSENRELGRAYAELDQLAALIAHDLKSPLLSISGCAHLLAEENHNPSDTSREMLKFIQDSVRHMGRMIDSLLKYSHLSAGPLKKVSCSMEQLLAAVLSHLQTTLKGPGAAVTHDLLPTVLGDATLLDQLLQNLIDNAVKYHGEDAPRVHVSCLEEQDQWVLGVHDNGIGIDTRYAEKIFQIFQRLHADESTFSGLGVGLALCKKIVERHGGRIWVESQPGQGAHFFFTLPRGANGERQLPMIPESWKR